MNYSSLLFWGGKWVCVLVNKAWIWHSDGRGCRGLPTERLPKNARERTGIGASRDTHPQPQSPPLLPGTLTGLSNIHKLVPHLVFERVERQGTAESNQGTCGAV